MCACVGITASSGQRAVRIVADSQAADVKLGFSEVLSEQIYSLTPSMEVSDVGSLIAGDVEQARQMMSALLANNKAESDCRVCFRLTDGHNKHIHVLFAYLFLPFNTCIACFPVKHYLSSWLCSQL